MVSVVPGDLACDRPDWFVGSSSCAFAHLSGNKALKEFRLRQGPDSGLPSLWAGPLPVSWAGQVWGPRPGTPTYSTPVGHKPKQKVRTPWSHGNVWQGPQRGGHSVEGLRLG